MLDKEEAERFWNYISASCVAGVLLDKNTTWVETKAVHKMIDEYTFINYCKPCISYPGCKECEDGVTCDSYRSREK